ncbi:MAG TPA: TonB-dependent receptor [Steroidobacteraceae bacterium]|jgi:iron complex outermembrane receptor protein|nr:TonB-dependent receptor [Steroidobacteraceae bacterium]
MLKGTGVRFRLGFAGGAIALLLTGAAIAGMPAGGSATGADAPAADAPAADTGASASGDKTPLTLEEVVVTSDRKASYSADLVQAGSFRGARQLDTPLTIAVVPSEVIESQQARSLFDALRNTAGVTSSQTSPTVYNNLSIRGIAVDNRANYRLNGSLPIINLIDLPLEDKDRVEALKGASALYYGFTTPSGIINLTMKRPTPETYLSVDGFGNDHGTAAGHIDFGDTWGMFGARLNAVYGHVDSGIDNTAGTRALFAGAFDFKPIEGLTISLDAEYLYKNVVEPGVFRFLTPPKSTVSNLYPTIQLPPLLDPATNFGPDWAVNHARESNVLLHTNYRITQTWSATVDVGDSYLLRDRRFNTLNPTNYATGDGLLSIGLQENHYENKNARAEIAGTFYTGPLVHEVIFGFSENVKNQVSPATVAALCPGATPTAKPVTCQQNFYNPVPIPYTPIPPEFADTTRIKDVGYYAFDRLKVIDWLDLLGGVRYSDYTESDVTTNVDTFRATPLSYSYGFVLKPRTWASLYGTFIQGLETTPAAPILANNYGQQLPATESTQREAGIKVEPRRGLLIQAAYFAINRASTYTNAQNFYVQDGRAQYKGEEVSVTGEVTRDLSIYGSALFLEAEQVNGAPTTVVTVKGVTTVTPTSNGRQIENVPKRQFSIAGEYRLTRLLAGLSVTAGAYYTGPRAINQLNSAFIPGYTLLDAGASYSTLLGGHTLLFRLNGENITRRRYWASTGGLLLSEGPPGSVKFSVAWKY